ncbi:hypothetical protein BBJ29_007397 [Phytophthora kernoviae]|uniref:DUF4246 domain-containing protein n=1 Tax=Phytophthora kernoviae TaxID=325452 RepID=A0A3F2RC14_9STRA|nr:hypothetical protein BBJ29_007397 [Phytophthora kernoviae]RLN52274.1 hypothetical protein BBP00_00009675 [Phytophthora kernoviae]
MALVDIFRRRLLQCHQSINTANDRSSYEVRRVTELDVLSAIGAVVNASDGDGVARFAQCAETRTKCLGAMERALLERHLTRLLRFLPSLGSTYERFCCDISDSVGNAENGLDAFRALVQYTVFALIRQKLQHDELRENANRPNRPEQLTGLLYCAKKEAVPILASWLLGEDDGCDDEESATFQRVVLMQNSASNDGLTFATHIPETFICDGECSNLGRNGILDGIEDELNELWALYNTVYSGKETSQEGALCDLLDPSLRCWAYYNSEVDADIDEKACQATLVDMRPQQLPQYYPAHSSGAPVTVTGLTTLQLVPLRSRKPQLQFQWLPADFQIGDDGNVMAMSPLHGSVHPHQFSGIYALISQLISRLLPLFELVLTSITTPNPPPPHQIGLGSTSQSDGKPITGEREAATPRDSPSAAETFSLRGRQIQVVTKLSSVRLDAAHPLFTGQHDDGHFNRGWQLDGDDHEHIVAVGYHILRARNISPPKLAFRTFAHCPTTSKEAELPSQGDVFLAFGDKTSGYFRGKYGRQFLQPCGSLELHEQRSIGVPSFFVHRLEPFELLDAAHPDGGEFTIATFYLVDPTRDPVVSTRTVRAEQWQQTRRFVQANVDMLRCPATRQFFPDEVARRIEEFAACQVVDSEARLNRQQLLKHRRRRQELRFLAPSLRLEELRLDLTQDE